MVDYISSHCYRFDVLEIIESWVLESRHSPALERSIEYGLQLTIANTKVIVF